MKYTHWLSGGLVKCLALLALVALATSAGAADTHAGWAKVRYIVGHPEYQKAGTPTWQKLERYMILHPGDSVRCNAESHADLIIGLNNGNVQVSPNSEVLLDKLTLTFTGLETIHDTKLTLKSGAMYGNVNRMPTGSKYEVKTPKGIAGIRGTRYLIYADGRLVVTEGCVLYSVLQPDSTFKVFEVCAGYAYDPATGGTRQATSEEKEDVTKKTLDAMSHGGPKNEWDRRNQDPREWRDTEHNSHGVLEHPNGVGTSGAGFHGGAGGNNPFIIFIPHNIEPSISPTTPGP